MSRYSLTRRQAFQPSCPLGGQWHVCDAGSKFVGCCDGENPCSSSGCKQGNLRPASFNPAYYGMFPDLECNSGSWYTCTGTNPPFMGCCKSNPCSRGCPTADLAAGWLGNNVGIACQFYAQGCSSPSSTGTASTSSNTSSSASSATTPQATDSGRSSTGPIVGGAFGGVAAIVIVAILLFYCYRRRKSRKVEYGGVDAQSSQQNMKSVPGATEAFSEPMTHYQGLSCPSHSMLFIHPP